MVPESPCVFPIVVKRVICGRESLQTALQQSPADEHTWPRDICTAESLTLNTEDTLLSTNWKDEGLEGRETSKCNTETLR